MTRRSLDNATREVSFAPATLDPEARTVEVVFTTGAAGVRHGWDESYIETLDVTEEAVDLSRLNAGAPVLDGHSWYRDSSEIPGVVVRAWLEDGEGRAVLRFDTDEVGQACFGKIQRGIITKVSVGYNAEYERVPPAERGQLPTYVARKWMPYEISLVAIPFDAGATIRSLKTKEEANPMPEATPVIDLTAERARSIEIMKLCMAHGLESARYIESGATLDQVRADVLAEITTRQAETQVALVAIAKHDPAPMRRAVEAAETAILNRHAPQTYKLTDDAMDFRGFSMMELARHFLTLSGQSVRGLGTLDMLGRAFTTSDLPLLLANVMNKSLRAGYGAVAVDYQRVFRRADASNFKSISSVSFSGADSLVKVGEHGEIQYGKMAESAETYALATYARIVSYTRQAMINDDLNGLTRVPEALGRAAAILENKTVWGIFTANAAMSDSVALFHSTHGNQSASAGAISATTVGAGYAAFDAQKGLDNEPIAVSPEFLIVSGDNRTTAEQYLNSTTVFTKPADVTPVSHKSLQLVVTPFLTGAPWYLAGGQFSSSVEYAYLSGQEGLYTETREGFDIDGVDIKARLDFGAGAVDFRTVYRNSAP